jgi:hypothetical protein
VGVVLKRLLGFLNPRARTKGGRMTMAKPPIRTIVKPLMHRRDALIAPQARKAPAEVPSSSGVHADFVSLTSKRAAKVVEQARRIARCTPSDETKQTWEDVAAHARYRFAKRPDFKQPSLLREGLAQLKTGCVGSAVDTLRKANPRAPAVRAALTKAEAMLTDLGKVATVGQVAKWEWTHNTKARLAKLTAGVNDALGDDESEWLKSEDVQNWAGAPPSSKAAAKAAATPDTKLDTQPARPHSVPADSAPNRSTLPQLTPAAPTPNEQQPADDDDGDEQLASPVFSEGEISPEAAAAARDFGFLPPRRTKSSSQAPTPSRSSLASPWPSIKRAAGQTPMISMPSISRTLASGDRRCRSAEPAAAASTPSTRSSPVWERLFNSEEPGDAAVAEARTGGRRRNGKRNPKAKTKLESRFSSGKPSASVVTGPHAQDSIYETGILSEVDIKQGRTHRRKAATPVTSSGWEPGTDAPTVERRGKPRTRDRKVSSDPPQLRAALAEAARLEHRNRDAATNKVDGKLLKRAVYGTEL